MSPVSAARGSTLFRREIALTATVLLLTIIATFFLARHFLPAIVQPNGDIPHVVSTALFTVVIAILIYGNFVYLVTRLGYFVRRLRHRAPRFEALVESHWEQAEPIVVLVPSYKEDMRTIRQTVLSAALQHHPNKRVVLLIDDPQRPRDRESAIQLAAARRIPREIASFLAEPKGIVDQAFARFSQHQVDGRADTRLALRDLLGVYHELVAWMDRCIADEPSADHTDAHFLAITFRDHRNLLHASARRLASALGGEPLTPADIEREYQRLTAVFNVDITTFERKRYQNVSLEANKAANLNTYIGLLGHTVRERLHADGWHIETIDPSEAGDDVTIIPDAAFVLTLDADSMLRPDYALRLSSVFAQQGNERVAVVQTPYIAIPNAPGALERIAGATTDMQYIVHQGFTWSDATFWVGANALLRKAALDDIRIEEEERGYIVSKYIQDHTVIEDTESTVDLAFQGWSLENYPERLAYSATPPDFGSLLIQRSRWANGGLLIVPKLVRHAFTRRFTPLAIPSFLLRFHYLTSIATTSIGWLALLFIPIDQDLFTPWIMLPALAYFALYSRDLRQNGYLPGDIFRVAAFNLMLVPVNMAGVLKSIQQGITGNRTPFARTPKVEGRTAAPAWAVTTLWLMLAGSLLMGTLHVMAENWLYAGFSLVMACGFAYAVLVFVGPKASWEDATRGIRSSLAELSEQRETTTSLDTNVRGR